MPYADHSFDFVYARLVLHYLSNQDLTKSLQELFRILKPEGKIYVVVRSNECKEATSPFATYDAVSGFTTYPLANGMHLKRRFHSKESIQDFLLFAGFQIMHVETYEEQLCTDFQRKHLSKYLDSLIEVLAVKKGFL